MEAPPQQQQQENPELTHVHLTAEMMQQFMDLQMKIRPHVNVDGLRKIDPKLFEKDVAYIEEATTVKELVTRVSTVRYRWLNDTFQSVRYNLEPTSDGDDNDIAVVFDVDEAPYSSFVKFLPTDTATPQLTFGFSNLRGGAYTLLGHVHSTVKNHEVGATLYSKLPYFGDAVEYDIQTECAKHANSIGREERSQNAKIIVHQSLGVKATHALCLGFSRRVLLPHLYAESTTAEEESSSSVAAASPYDSKEFLGHFPADNSPFTMSRKGFVSSNIRYDNTVHHQHRMLRLYYPLPVAGMTLDVQNELAGTPLLGGDATFIRNEIQMHQLIPLHKYFTLDIGMRLGGIWTPPILGGTSSSIPYSDRLFLTWRNIRGRDLVGPQVEIGGKKAAAVGGNALWALSASLNMPFWLYPNNGIASMHVFANAGNLAMFESLQEAKSGLKNFLANSSAAIGAGLVITQLPVLGPFANGRLEFNASIPFDVKNGNISVEKVSLKSVKDSLRFGLVWSSGQKQ